MLLWNCVCACVYVFCLEEKRYYICHGMSWVFLWSQFVVFADLPDIIKWIGISNICGAQRTLIQGRWTLSSSCCGTASGVCLFNHHSWNKIKRQCVASSLKLLSQHREREREGSSAGGQRYSQENTLLLCPCNHNPDTCQLYNGDGFLGRGREKIQDIKCPSQIVSKS